MVHETVVHDTYGFAHDVPVSFLETAIANSTDYRHVNFELLQSTFNGKSCSQRPPEFWMSKDLRQSVNRFPQILNLIQQET